VVLEDDKGMFSPYNSVLFMRYVILAHGCAARE
jgi:glycine betaine/choline ABC-type transport system substrate-binding protein